MSIESWFALRYDSSSRRSAVLEPSEHLLDSIESMACKRTVKKFNTFPEAQMVILLGSNFLKPREKHMVT